MEKPHAEREHARLGGSQAHRWMNCYGSVALIESLPPREPSEAALRGTYVHEACERALRNFLNYKVTGEETDPDWARAFDEEAVESAQAYVSAIWHDVLEEALTGKAWGIEEKATLDAKLDMSGIIDFWAIYINDKGKRTLCVCDYKNGYHYVDIKKNAQLIFYADSMLKEIRVAGKDLDFIRTIIFQPNSDGKPYKEATYTVKQIDAWDKRFYKAAYEIYLKKKSKLKVGSWCAFCPAQGICKAYAKDISTKSSLALLDPDSITFPLPETLSDPVISKIALNAKALTEFIDAVKVYAIERYKSNKVVPGTKVVLGPEPRRKWKENEELVAQGLKAIGIEEPFKQKLRTLTEIEKKLGGKDKAKGLLEPFIEYTKQSVLLVSDTDPREAVKKATDLLE